MKRMPSIRTMSTMSTICLGAMLSLSCASTPRPSSLVDAQTSLAGDDVVDLTEQSPTLLREARAAYVEGEDAYRSGDVDEARILGYIALARVGIARDLAARETATRMSEAYDEALASSGKERAAASRLAELEARLQSVSVRTDDPVAMAAKSQVVGARTAQAEAIRRGMPTKAAAKFEEGRVLLEGAVEALGLGLYADSRDAARRAESIFVGTMTETPAAVAKAPDAAAEKPAKPADKPAEKAADKPAGDRVADDNTRMPGMSMGRTYDFAEGKVSTLELELASALGDGRDGKCPQAFKEFSSLVEKARARLDRNDVARALEFAVRAEERFGKCANEKSDKGEKGGKSADATPKADDRRAAAAAPVAKPADVVAACPKALIDSLTATDAALAKRTTADAGSKQLFASAKTLADAGKCDAAKAALEPVTAMLAKPERDLDLDKRVDDALARARMAKVQTLRARNLDNYKQAERNLTAALDRAKATPADALRLAEESVVLFRAAYDEFGAKDAEERDALARRDEVAKANRAAAAEAEAVKKAGENDRLLKAALEKLAGIEQTKGVAAQTGLNDADKAALLQRQEDDADAAIRAATVALDLCEKDGCEERDANLFVSGREALRAARRAFSERKYAGAAAIATEAKDQLTDARRKERAAAAPAVVVVQDEGAKAAMQSALDDANRKAADAEAKAAAALAALSDKERAAEEEKQRAEAEAALRAANVQVELCKKEQCEERDAGLFLAGREAVLGAQKVFTEKRYASSVTLANEGRERLEEAQQKSLVKRDVEADNARRAALSARDACERGACVKRDAQLHGDAGRAFGSAEQFMTQNRYDDALRLFVDARVAYEQALAKVLPVEMPQNLKRVRLEGTQLILSPKLQFVSGTARLTKNSAPGLDELATVLKTNAGAIAGVKVLGHTDNKGKPEKNVALSKDRATSVREALAQRGVAPELFVVVDGLGDAQPVADNATSAGREQNRRVEIHLQLR
jgi:outer membrane protein OmpA-like peptidoglycan-associated protein